MFKEQIKKENGNLKTALISVLIGVTVSISMMLIFSFLIVIAEIDSAYAVPLATVCMAAGCFAGSFYFAKKIGKNGYLIGFLNGVAVFFIITIISLIVSEWHFTINTVFHLIITLTASVAGGILGVNNKRSKRYI